MKKISLLFASIAIVSFTANAQEPVKVKAKQPVRVSPVEQSVKAEKVTVAETTTHSDIQPTTRVEKVETGEVKATAPRSANLKKRPVTATKAKAAAVPVKKAGEAK